MSLLIGADPEFFLKKDGRPVNAHGLIPGTKANPHKVRDGAVQVDGTALEFNIDPAEDEVTFVHNIGSVLDQLKIMVPQFDFVFEPTIEFGEEEFKTFPEKSKELGCDPDFNAWTMEMNEPPCAASLMRTAAGHVHIGWRNSEAAETPMEEASMFVKQLDVFLGLPSLILDPDNKRREMYGKAGAFRPKSYGVEYRVLSNYWLKHEAYIRQVYRNAKLAFEEMVKGNFWYEKFGHIEDIINSSDAEAAFAVLDTLNTELETPVEM